MATQISLLSLLETNLPPLEQLDHFKADHLTQLFQSKIAKSQATGKDGTRIDRFADYLAAEAVLIEQKVSAGTYRFTAFKERLILRGAKRTPRQISIPTVRDRLTLRAVCQVLHSHQGKTIGEPPHALVRRVAAAIRDGDQASKSFVRIDVKDFFPSISHKILVRELSYFKFDEKIRDLCMTACSTPTGEPGQAVERGVPQGLSISGALSSLFMLRFDIRRLKENANYFRYVDDILIITETADAENVLETVKQNLRSRGLAMHPKGTAGKTEISLVSKGIDFLGYNIREEEISVRSSSFKRMFRNIQKVVTDYRYRRKVDKLIFRLNLKTTGCVVDKRRRGWMMFFSHTENMSQLAHLDAFVRRQLMRVKLPPAEQKKIKRFVKSYHEIRHRLDTTSYIPNFDLFDPTERAEVVSILMEKDLSEVLAMEAQNIEILFSRLVSREVHDLEQDVGSPS